MDILIAYGWPILWLVLFIVQFADLGSSVVDVRHAPLRAEGHRVGRKFSTTFWLLPFLTAVVIAVVAGVDVAVRLIFVQHSPGPGVIVLLVLAAIAVAVVIGIVALLSPREVASYASLRSAIAAVESRRTTKAQVEAFRKRLAEVDARQRDLRVGSRDTRGQRQFRRDIDALVREFRVDPPSGLSAIGSIRRGAVGRFLLGSSWWRLVPVVAGILLALIIGIWGSPVLPVGGILLAAILIVLVLLNFVIAFASARASLAAKASWRAAGESERAKLEEAIGGLERTSRRGVAGLGERVARALQILREQQG